MTSVMLVVMAVVFCIWIAVELKYDGVVKSVVRIASSLILCVMFMVLMYTAGLIVF
jgi:hypothetical protein